MALGLPPFFKELTHIAGQVFYHRQIAQRFDRQASILYDLVDMGAAGPTRNSVYHRRAGTTHTDPAGKAITQGGIEVTLDPRDDVKYGLAGLLGNLEILEITAPCNTAPYADRYRICRRIHHRYMILLY